MSRPPCDPEDVKRRFLLAQSRLKDPQAWNDWRLEDCYRRYTDISWYMWEINRRMALAHNRRRGTKGHLWGKRFVSKVVEDGES
ncbi:MAG: hypothetical protein GY807_04730, partial [Gammaproteobacteria bacterium]|nr:hypothetical protein [Gammaproteobacteria bacterium]